jgi:hypothetical protein
MHINVIYDQSQSSLPAGFVAAVNYVVNYFDTTFTNNVTVNIDLGYGEIAGQSLGSGALGESETFFDSVAYSQAVNALKANQPSATQQSAYSTLPDSSPLSGGTLWVSTAEEKALGLLAASNSAIDGYVGLSRSYPFSYSAGATPASGQYYFDGVLAHEFSEVLGRSSMLGEGLGGTNSYTIMDLFRYSAPGSRQLGTGGPAYFSINNGSTNLDSWNTNPSGDLGDWSASAGADAFLAFSPSGQIDWIKPTDVTLMNVVGWNTSPAAPPPVVTTSNLTKPANTTLAASSLFTVNDPNGYAITEYQFWDSTRDPASGHFYINGVQQAAGKVIDVTASQFGQVTFVTGTVSNALQVRAFDGVSWSAGDSAAWAPFSIDVAVSPPPVVTTSNLTKPANTTLAASNLFSVNDLNGYAITEYQFWDSTRDPASGHFYINGVQQAAGTVIDVTASQLGQVTFVTGTVSNALQVRAFDGLSWSAGDSAAWAPFSINIPALPPPVATTSNLTKPANAPLAASSLFTVSDPNGYAITEYQFWDSTRDPASGHFYINGVQQAAGTVIDVPASQIGQVKFVTGTVSNVLQVRAFDGVSWSAGDTAAWAPFTIGINGQAGTLPPPVVTTSNLARSASTALAASSLFTVSDPNGFAITEYQFWDSTRDPASGHFYINGVQQAPGTVIDVPASQMGQVDFVTGTVGNALQVRAFDGTSWSADDTAAWAPFTISINGQSAPAQLQTDVGDHIALLSQYMASSFPPSDFGYSGAPMIGGSAADSGQVAVFAPGGVGHTHT